MSKKQPKLVLRESCVADVTRSWPPGRFLEMGAGTGGMTRTLLRRGFWGAASDLGVESRDAMRRNLAFASSSIDVFDTLSDLGSQEYDYLFAFEVLEHIEDDVAALREWSAHLKDGGKVLLSVPAHSRKFGKSDEIVGHVRRYEKRELEALLTASGYTEIKIVNYGFPVTELTRWVSNRLVKSDRSYDGLSMEQRSIESARRKPKAINRVLSIVGGGVVRPFQIIQRWFYGWDLGDGYVATALKGAKSNHMLEGQRPGKSSSSSRTS